MSSACLKHGKTFARHFFRSVRYWSGLELLTLKNGSRNPAVVKSVYRLGQKICWAMFSLEIKLLKHAEPGSRITQASAQVCYSAVSFVEVLHEIAPCISLAYISLVVN